MPSNVRRGTIPRTPMGISEHLDEAYTQKGFFGEWAHLYRSRNVGFPKAWSSDEIMYMGLDTGTLAPSDQSDAAGAPLELLRGDDIVVSVSHRSERMPFLENNADFHQIRFYHNGSFTLDTELGRLDVREGDFVVIPKGIGFRETPKDHDGNVVLIFETKENIITAESLWDSAGFASLFIDYSLMRCPEPVGQVDETDTDVRLKYRGKTHTLTYDFDPTTDVIGWLGDPVLFSMNVWDVPGLGSSHGFLPPPAAAVLMGESKSFFFNVMSPKPMPNVPAPDGSFGAPAHLNDYEEIWFNHAAADAEHTNGHLWRLPPILPHPGIKRPPFYPEAQPTERVHELKINFDTSCALEWSPAVRDAFFPDPQISMYTSVAGTHIGVVPEEASKYAKGRESASVGAGE